MTDVQITVRGTARVTHAPERATVHLRVGAEGADRDQVQARASRTARAVTDSITERAAGDGPVADWSSEQLHLGSYYTDKRARSDDPVHTASVTFRVTYRDFAALSTWLAEVAALDGVEVQHTDWTLTPDLYRRLTARAREDAVRDAQERAVAYANTLGLGSVRPVALADPGLLAADAPSGDRLLHGELAAYAGGRSGLDVQFTAQDIEVTASVDMRFVAS
jgi:uncharacterized protein YggE